MYKKEHRILQCKPQSHPENYPANVLSPSSISGPIQSGCSSSAFSQTAAYNVLSRQKETVRLGEGEYRCDLILDTAIDRAVTVCRNFTGLARSFSTDEIVAVATSAAREAKNRNVLLNRLRHEASIDVRVISGRDEARLIYMGVVTGIHLGAQQAVFIDIGGGSTEIAIGGQHTSCHLESLLLGSIRLTNLFFSGNEEKPVHQKKYERIKEHVRSVIEPALPGLRSHHFDTAIGSSGTIINLAEIAIKTGGRIRQ